MTCAQIALALSVLGTIGVGVLFSMGMVTLRRGRLHFRSIRIHLMVAAHHRAYS